MSAFLLLIEDHGIAGDQVATAGRLIPCDPYDPQTVATFAFANPMVLFAALFLWELTPGEIAEFVHDSATQTRTLCENGAEALFVRPEDLEGRA